MKQTDIQRDLFGEIVVSADDVTIWLENIPRISADSPRAAMYVKQWRVIEKIRSVKEQGRWNEIVAMNDDNWHATVDTGGHTASRKRLSHVLEYTSPFPFVRRPRRS